MENYDVIVIGNGAAGDAVARGLARSHRVAVVERAELGGECLNDGCIPSKALIDIAHSSPSTPWDEVVARLRAVPASIRGPTPDGGMREDGIMLVRGDACFLEPGQVRVGDRLLHGREVVVATGTDPGLPPIPGLAGARPQTNQTVFSMARLPRRLAVIGAGPIGLELGQALHRLGSEVTVFEVAGRIAPTEDAEVSLELARALAEEGMRLETGASIERVDRLESGVVRIVAANGETTFDEVLVAAGRKPRIPEGLTGLGLATTRGGFIQIDDCGRTSLPGVWAAGDITGKFQFTHYASYQASHIRGHLAANECRPIPDAVVPWAIFTEPEVGHVGPTEEQARAQYGRVEVARLDAAHIDWFRTRRRPAGFAKVIADADSGRLIAAHIVSDRASSIIGEAALAVAHGLSAREVGDVIHPYPGANDLLRWACSQLADRLKRSP
ncbi:MAG: mercuric reductase [Dehalococcoidia bacterium]